MAEPSTNRHKAPDSIPRNTKRKREGGRGREGRQGERRIGKGEKEERKERGREGGRERRK